MALAVQRSVKIVIEYDGSGFAGWQVQPNQRTVQGEIEQALHRLTGEKLRILGAGRTDAGVHASGQVAGFKSASSLSSDVFKRGLNGLLPYDIRIVSAAHVHDGFNARYDALRRIYRYTLSRRSRAIGRQYAWYPRTAFDLNMMRDAAQCLVGEHSYETFAKTGDAKGSFDSIVYRIDWMETEHHVVFEVEAIRFFHNMIRIIMGTLMDVGRGKMSSAHFKDIFQQHDRTLAGATAPPHGLNLYKIIYKEL